MYKWIRYKTIDLFVYFKGFFCSYLCIVYWLVYSNVSFMWNQWINNNSVYEQIQMTPVGQRSIVNGFQFLFIWTMFVGKEKERVLLNAGIFNYILQLSFSIQNLMCMCTEYACMCFYLYSLLQRKCVIGWKV